MTPLSETPANGSVVRLASGGPLMTVSQTPADIRGITFKKTVDCVWFDDECNYKTGCIPLDALIG